MKQESFPLNGENEGFRTRYGLRMWEDYVKFEISGRNLHVFHEKVLCNTYRTKCAQYNEQFCFSA
jgi:hypothetical protein